MEIFVGCEKSCDQRAMQEVINQIKNKPASVLGFATGSTPEGLYRGLIGKYRGGEVCFAKVKTFNLDEYIGIPKNHKCSYHYYMCNLLFSHINVDDKDINLPNGKAIDIDRECEDYEKKIMRSGGIDLQILGLGPNGHIAFNEPGTPFDSITHMANLTDSTIKANSRFFDSPDQVPRQAITMGIKTIMQAGRIIMMAKGKGKASIMRKALKGPVTPEVPASVIQDHPNALVILDNEAASKLE
ncbi:MAG TPA: glucosamine-6-phosphate deaminase [Bacillota bacterium]|nr:glucosamine-6-phosphate deaminase [Bacillota bacterium]